MNKNLYRQNGSILIITIMIMMVLIILGISILTISLAEAKQSIHQQDRVKAYFIARSGIEVALDKVQSIVGDYENVNTLFKALSVYTVYNPIKGSVDAGVDTYNVLFKDEGIVQNNYIKISAEGTVNGVQNTTALSLYFSSPYYMPSDWLNPGQIIRKGNFEMTTQAVVIKNVKNLGHAPKKESTAQTTWTAPSLHFIDEGDGFSLEITANQLNLNSKIISFKKSIYSKNDNNALKLLVYPNGFLNESGEKLPYNIDGNLFMDVDSGILVLKDGMYNSKDKSSVTKVFDSGYYFYKSGTELSSTAGRNTLQKIENQDTINYIDEIIKAETALSFSSNNAIWSKN